MTLETFLDLTGRSKQILIRKREREREREREKERERGRKRKRENGGGGGRGRAGKGIGVSLMVKRFTGRWYRKRISLTSVPNGATHGK